MSKSSLRPDRFINLADSVQNRPYLFHELIRRLLVRVGWSCRDELNAFSRSLVGRLIEHLEGSFHLPITLHERDHLITLVQTLLEVSHSSEIFCLQSFLPSRRRYKLQTAGDIALISR